MNKLSKRLEVVASFIDNNDKAMIDVGCDHGLLSIYLAKTYKDMKIIASDINNNALNNAKNNIEKNKLKDRIDIRLGSGISVINDSDNIDTIVVAGMGANTIIGFLKYSPNKLKNINKIVIQSNTDLYFLRKNMSNIGYYIEDEELVLDSDKIYTVIKFIKGRRRYSYKELYLGPILINKNNKLFKTKCTKEFNNLKLILKNIKKGHYFYRLKLKRNIRILENYIA